MRHVSRRPTTHTTRSRPVRSTRSLNDLTAVGYAAKQLGGLEVVQDYPDRRAVRDVGRRARRSSRRLNEALQQVKDDGTLTDLYQQYFKTDPPRCVCCSHGPAARAQRRRHHDGTSVEAEQEGAYAGALFSLRVDDS